MPQDVTAAGSGHQRAEGRGSVSGHGSRGDRQLFQVQPDFARAQRCLRGYSVPLVKPNENTRGCAEETPTEGLRAEGSQALGCSSPTPPAPSAARAPVPKALSLLSPPAFPAGSFPGPATPHSSFRADRETCTRQRSPRASRRRSPLKARTT